MPENTRSSELGKVCADFMIEWTGSEYGATALEALIASKVEEAKTLPKALEHAYKMRIAELEKQIKVVEDFAYVIQALQSKEGEK